MVTQMDLLVQDNGLLRLELFANYHHSCSLLNFHLFSGNIIDMFSKEKAEFFNHNYLYYWHFRVFKF